MSSVAVATIAELLGVSGLELVLKPEWRASVLDHREQIQRDLQARLAISGSDSSFSISHSGNLGGYALLVSSKWQLGLDIETVARVTASVARRICQDDAEFQEAPSPSALWCAKESSFKSLKGPAQPSVVGEVRISNWQSRDQLFMFNFSSNRTASSEVLTPSSTLISGQGVSWTDGENQFAVCIWQP